jgi:hypothetical protein
MRTIILSHSAETGKGIPLGKLAANCLQTYISMNWIGS